MSRREISLPLTLVLVNLVPAGDAIQSYVFSLRQSHIADEDPRFLKIYCGNDQFRDEDIYNLSCMEMKKKFSVNISSMVYALLFEMG